MLPGMAEFTAKKVSRHVALTTAFQLIHEVDQRQVCTVRKLLLSNVTNGNVNVRVCYVPNGGTAGIGNALLWDYSLSSNEFIELAEGDMFRGVGLVAQAASNDSVTLKFAGEEENAI